VKRKEREEHKKSVKRFMEEKRVYNKAHPKEIEERRLLQNKEQQEKLNKKERHRLKKIEKEKAKRLKKQKKEEEGGKILQ